MFHHFSAANIQDFHGILKILSAEFPVSLKDNSQTWISELLVTDLEIITILIIWMIQRLEWESMKYFDVVDL